MASTPRAPNGRSSGNGQSRQLHPQQMIDARKLYLEKRFKNCINACDQLLDLSPRSPLSPTSFTGSPSNVELHAVHRAFLIFHQAISYECMGIAAHKFSQNKLNFLSLAKEKFETALEILPPPFATGEDVTYSIPRRTSPTFSQDEDFEADQSFPSGATPAPLRDLSRRAPDVRVSDATTRSPSQESFDSTTTGTTVSVAFTAPDFDKYSYRDFPQIPPSNSEDLWTAQDLCLTRSTPTIDVQDIDIGTCDDDSEDEREGHRDLSWLPRSMLSLNLAAHNPASDSDDDQSIRSSEMVAVGEETPLSAAINSLRADMAHDVSPTKSLRPSHSTQHTFREDLAPPPLFNKALAPPKLRFSEPVVPLKVSQPLPRTPHAPHAPHAHHTHYTLPSARKTAVQTLISKFEGTLPSPDTPSSYTTATPPMSTSTRPYAPTPITPRFNMIRNAFEPHHHSPQSQITAYLTSHALARYNAHLASFRTCLRTACTSVEEALDTARSIQQKRDEEKVAATRHSTLPTASTITTTTNNDDVRSTMPQSRLASMWLLSSTPTRRRVTPRVSHPPRECIARPQSSSPQQPPHGRYTRSSSSSRKRPLNRPEESAEKRTERIEKLRQNGMRVCKEKYGWKGEGWYEGFRRDVEAELRA